MPNLFQLALLFFRTSFQGFLHTYGIGVFLVLSQEEKYILLA
nr:hypothetical protein Q903MT_gene2735 [Picea sitchensis]